jgi:hypothetical protein
MNSMVTRVDEHLKGMLQIFSRMFGEGFWANSIFLFTRWEVDKKTEKKRGKVAGYKTMDQFYQEFKVLMNENFSITVERE